MAEHTLMICECRGAPNTVKSQKYPTWDAAIAAAEDPKEVAALLVKMGWDECDADSGAQAIIDDTSDLYLMIAHEGMIVWGWPSINRSTG